MGIRERSCKQLLDDLRKGNFNGNCKSKHQIALCAELTLEEALDLSSGRLRNERIHEFPAVGPVLVL